MGGAFVAIAEGSSAAYYNPAGLVRMPRLNVGGMYTEPFGEGFGVTFQYLSVSGTLPLQTSSLVAQVGLGISWLGFEISDIPIWNEEGSEGTFTALSSIYLLSLGLAFPGGAEWTIGASAKLYRESILEGRGEGLGVDLALLGSFFVADMPIAIGVNAMDIGKTKILWRGTAGEPENYVPWVNKLGLAVPLWEGRALLACDFDWAVGRPPREQTVHLGVEVQPLDALFLRGGFNANLEGAGEFSCGLGIRLFDNFSVDYAYLLTKVFGGSHLISAQFVF
jgi:hypothetical protein